MPIQLNLRRSIHFKNSECKSKTCFAANWSADQYKIVKPLEIDIQLTSKIVIAELANIAAQDSFSVRSSAFLWRSI